MVRRRRWSVCHGLFFKASPLRVLVFVIFLPKWVGCAGPAPCYGLHSLPSHIFSCERDFMGTELFCGHSSLFIKWFHDWNLGCKTRQGFTTLTVLDQPLIYSESRGIFDSIYNHTNVFVVVITFQLMPSKAFFRYLSTDITFREFQIEQFIKCMGVDCSHFNIDVHRYLVFLVQLSYCHASESDQGLNSGLLYHKIH